MVSTRKRPGEPGQFRQSHEKGAYPTATMSSAGKGNQWTGPVKESRSRDDAALNRMGPLRWPARTADAIAIASRTASDKVTPPRHSAQRYRGPDAWRCRLEGGPPIAGVGTWGRIGEPLRRSDFPTTVSGQLWGGSRHADASFEDGIAVFDYELVHTHKAGDRAPWSGAGSRAGSRCGQGAHRAALPSSIMNRTCGSPAEDVGCYVTWNPS